MLDAALGDDKERLHRFMRRWPLLAVGRCGVVLTHGAPAKTCPTLDDFEALTWDGYQDVHIHRMYGHDPLAGLLWSRSATDAQARALLEVVAEDE